MKLLSEALTLTLTIALILIFLQNVPMLIETLDFFSDPWQLWPHIEEVRVRAKVRVKVRVKNRITEEPNPNLNPNPNYKP